MMIRDDAILAGRRPAGSGGNMLTFLTRRCGKVRLYYKRLPGRSKVEFFDPLRAGELIFTGETERAPGRMHSFHCERLWPAVRMNLDRLVNALHMAEGASLLCSEGESSPEIFELIMTFLGHLEGGGAPVDLRVLFDLRLLHVAGFAPSLERCCACGLPAAGEEVPFSVREGGVLCDRCLSGERGPLRRISRGTVSFMRRAQSMPPEKAARLRLSGDTSRELPPLVDEMLESVYERPSLSTRVLRQMERARRAF